ncbi:hypothetical protein Rhow_006898 [Rhodococcus wratislaviensis]|uniref:AAA domain-containing protein n=1 Tax=Rhodococcus wratislaviensis TaxID=44752 RepID=A0A402CGT1_RHOWR|nr:AAA family ATPase [Rhodococcus wratislaviensis]GCE42769.1 hypothetical protein Rhow_006898 [Rhodococcus wratislaviensis]
MTITDTQLEEITGYDDTDVDLLLSRDRFHVQTLDEALEEADTHDDWLVSGLISSSTTLIFGEAKIGKSWLVSHLIGALLTGKPFLGVDVPDRPFSVGIGYTDDNGNHEYGQRIRTVLPEVAENRSVLLYRLETMTSELWSDFYDVVVDAGHNLLVIDNLTQVLTGSINEDDTIRRCFNDGIRRFVRAGIPVVIIGHSSDKSFNGRKPETPMGSAYISQAVRWLVRVSKTRTRNLKVNTYGNVSYGAEMILRPEAGARFSVIERKDDADEVDEDRQRSVQRMDRTSEQARFVVEQCQGLSRNAAAVKLADEFDGTVASFKTALSSRGLSKLVEQSSAGVWTEVQR